MSTEKKFQKATESHEAEKVGGSSRKKTPTSEARTKLMLGELRRARGLTQLDVALELGVRESTFANWERGRDGSDVFFRIRKLCEVLSCSFEDLFEDSQSENS
ncbi:MULTISPECIES: helix-turn-helix domain-containing protein [Trichocoleus]|uniref:Helix-turn-helix domain-containing protein n=1 Tax=Trichocoleus desertorum GB2-A4 TaxID=2933944 RepID=A0ABV0JEK0_9CYAN|nr:helix-turn-helix transcriptional regulator [Trichocoleus sp. FACHB-46]